MPLDKIKRARLKAKHDYSTSVRKLLDEIEQLLVREDKSIAALAREINRGYVQTYHWLRVRRFKPGPIGVMLLTEWRDKALKRISEKN